MQFEFVLRKQFMQFVYNLYLLLAFCFEYKCVICLLNKTSQSNLHETINVVLYLTASGVARGGPRDPWSPKSRKT